MPIFEEKVINFAFRSHSNTICYDLYGYICCLYLNIVSGVF